MTDEDVHDHDIIEREGLDADTVCNVIEKCNEPRESSFDVGKEVADMLGIDEMMAEDLVQKWREPDWPIAYSKTFIVDDVDVFEDFMLNHRGYEPYFARDLDRIYVTWQIDKTGDRWGTNQTTVEIVEVNGVDMTDD